MRLTTDQITKAINLLNIQSCGNNSGNWMGIVCPIHTESTPGGSCSVNLESGIIHCFSCHQTISVIELMKQRFNVGFKQALELIDNHFNICLNKPLIQSKIKERKQSKAVHEFEEISFNPENYYYTRQRRFTKEFCKEFSITRCLSGIYNDYMVIPCSSKVKNINEFECRKLFEFEQLCMFFDIINGDYYKLKNKFERYIKKNKIKLVNYLLYKDNELFYNDQIKYLLQPKVRYVQGSQLYRTIFNVDNLDFNKDLYIVEGTGSLPKIWMNITKNVSCTFGSNIDEEQVEILKKFKKIIIVPDNDNAGYLMVKFLSKQLDNIYIKDIKIKDTDDSYIDNIKNKKEISTSEYLSKHILRKNLW